MIRYLRGYVRIRVEGYSPERFLNLCSFHQIFIWGLTPVGNAYEMYMTLSGFRQIKPYARKTHTKVLILQKTGLPFFLRRYRKRKLLFTGVFLCIVLLKVYSMFIWDVHFEGNEKWTDETLIEFLASKNVSPFMLKSRVDCPQIVKDIREEYQDIVWVSASVDGSRLKIQVKENEDTFWEEGDPAKDAEGSEEAPVSEEAHPTDLVATEDGVITDIITRSGVPQVHAGDTVKAGDILVLGRIDVTDDSGEVIGYQYEQSDADVFADTQIEYSDSMPLTYEDKIYDGRERAQVYLRLSDWNLMAGTIKNSYDHSEVYTYERQIKLGENFYLPVHYGYRKAKSYSFETKRYTKEELRQQLSRNFNRFCEELVEKGVQIKENSVKILIDENSAAASGMIYVNKRITQEADTEILTIERKEQDESIGTDD